MVKVAGLVKVYRSRRRGDVRAVDGVSFDVRRGEIVGLLGPNGAGKTTTIKCLCALVRATAGEIEVDGVDVVARPRKAVERIAAVLEGNRNIYWRLTPAENLEFFASIHGLPARTVRADISDLIERFGLKDKHATPARMLSKGMQQKLALACALVKRTPVVLLDEPTLGLDVEASHELRALLRGLAGERTVLVSSHDMDVVQDVCERVIIVNEGRVVTDDRVANLLQLFRTRAYKVVVAGRIDAERIRECFPHARVEADTTQTTIEVELADGSLVYGLVDVLREAGTSIESIDRMQPDLEQVFLEIVRGSR
jgi:ABC-2 type transport system ATP-binding protein